MFFDKSWKDVSEEEIDEMAKSLSEKMGGWIFHKRVDLSSQTPHILVTTSHPATMTNNLKSIKN